MENEVQTLADRQREIDKLPFNIERKGDCLEVTRKPKGHLSKKDREQFEKNSVVVKIVLFERKTVEKLYRLSQELYMESKPSQSTWSKIFSKK